MNAAATAILWFTLSTQSGSAALARDVVLTLPHPLGSGESAWVEVQVGPIGRGREIDVTTGTGRELGVISPFGVRYGQPAGLYTLPVPADAIADDRLAIRLTISQAGAPPRAPTDAEVPSVRLTIARQ